MRYRRYQPGDGFLDRSDMNRRGEDLSRVVEQSNRPPDPRRFEPFWVVLTDEDSSGFYSGRRLKRDGKTDNSPTITYTGNLREVNDTEGLEVETSEAAGLRVRVVGRYADASGNKVYLFVGATSEGGGASGIFASISGSGPSYSFTEQEWSSGSAQDKAGGLTGTAWERNEKTSIKDGTLVLIWPEDDGAGGTRYVFDHPIPGATEQYQVLSANGDLDWIADWVRAHG